MHAGGLGQLGVHSDRLHAPAVVLLCRRVLLQPHDVSGVHSGSKPGAFPAVSSERVLIPGCHRERPGRQLQNSRPKPPPWPTRSSPPPLTALFPPPPPL